jgi:hypothetical protein
VSPAADLGGGHSAAACSNGAAARNSGVLSPTVDTGGGRSAAACSSGAAARSSGLSPAADWVGGRSAAGYSNVNASDVLHVGRDSAVGVVVNGGLARDNSKEVSEVGMRLDASTARSGLPVASVSLKVTSHRKATPGTALATGTHGGAQLKAPMSFKAALCNGLEAATSNRSSRNSVQLATGGSRGASECKGSRTISIEHKAAVRGEGESAKYCKAV